ncbi:hypothetical protein LINGRAHAP2_LOCUS4780 [Linum grandiflorum]
MYTHSWIKDD